MATRAESAPAAIVPKNVLHYAGPAFGVAGMFTALLAFLGRDTHGALQLLGQFGPRWLFWALFVSLIYSLLRYIIKAVVKLGQQLVDHFGRLVDNTGNGALALSEGATALKSVSQRSEAVTQEMQLQVGYLAQQGRNMADMQQGMVRALMRIEDKMGITPEGGNKV